MAQTGVKVRTAVHVQARAYTFVANELIRAFFEITDRLGLSGSYIADNQQIIERGLRTWITTRKLESAVLEVWDPMTDQVRKRVDLAMAYVEDGNERYQTDIERIKTNLGETGGFAGCQYRIIVELEDGAADVEGWEWTNFRSVDHLTRQDVGNVIDSAAAQARMFVWG